MGWLRDRDARALLLWAAAGIVGIVIATQFVFVAFPEASINFKIATGDATAIARDFLKARGADVNGYESSVILKTDDDAKIYLERQLGLERANTLMASNVTVFAFEVRFFRDLQREEYAVRVDPSGRVVGMKHVVEEERAGARLEAASARGVAESFLRSVEPRFADYTILPEEQNSKDRPNRRDWTFTWERKDFRAADAPYRITVTVLGDAVGGLEAFLKVPEAWKRDFDRLRSENVLYQLLAQVAFAMLNLFVVVAVVQLIRRGAVRWRMAAGLGAALAVVFVALGLNTLPLARAGYETTTSYAGFLATQIVGAVIGGLLLAAYIALIFAAAEPIYRERWPERLRLALAWRPRAFGTREFFRAMVIGLSLAGATVGAVTVFYIVGRSVGIWAPQDLKYSDAVNTVFPWLFPLGIGVEAASNEEFLFRLFAIPLLLGLTRSRVIAVVVPAFAWGFLHSTYPVEPGYVRGIEVGLVGIVTGLIFLRFGLLPTLVWHYTYDAALIGLLLVRSENLYFQISGLVVGLALVLPLVASAALLARRRRFVEDEALLNRADPVPPPPIAIPAPAIQRVYVAAGERAIRVALAIGAIGVLLFVLIQPEAIGSYIESRITPRDATRMADDIMRARTVDVSRYQKVATFGGMPATISLTREDQEGPQPATDPYANEYLRRQVGIAGANKLYAEQVPSVFWRVRYFRDGEKEEYTVLLRPDGRLHTVLHKLDQQAAGADLSKDDARAIAERYLRDTQGLDLSLWKIVEANSEKLPRRTDHTLVWERSEGIGEAHVRSEVKLSGNEVTSYRVFVKIPEEWEREQRERNFGEIGFAIARALVAGSAAIALLVLFFRNVRRQRIPWRALGILAGVSAIVSLAGTVNTFPQQISRYGTESPFASYVGSIVAINLFVGLFFFGATLILLGAAWLFAALAFGEERIPSLPLPAPYWRDAFVLGLAGTGGLLLLGRLSAFAGRLLPADHRSLSGSGPSWLDSLVPALGPVSGLPLSAVLAPAFVALVAAAGARYLPSRFLRMVAIAVLAAVLVGEVVSPLQIGRDLAVGLVQLALVVGWITRIARFNLLALAIGLVGAGFIRAGLDLLSQPNNLYLANGLVLLLLAALVYAAPLILWRRGLGAPAPAPAPVGVDQASAH